MFTEDDVIFTDGRRFRWWWQLATQPAAVASFVVLGVVGAGMVAVQARNVAGIGASQPEPPVTRLTGAAYRIASPPPTAPKTVTPRVAVKPTTPPASAREPVREPVRSAAREPAPPRRPPITRTAPTTNATLAAKTVVSPVTISSSAARSTSAPVTSAPHAAPGWLVVSSRPWGSLYVDGRPYGTTPQTNLWLPPGAHRVEIRRVGFEPYVASVTIDSNREFRLTRVTLRPASR